MQQAGYHHANHLAQQLKSNIERRDENLLTYIQTAIDLSSITDVGDGSPSDISTVTPSQQRANAAQTDVVQMEMSKILQ